MFFSPWRRLHSSAAASRSKSRLRRRPIVHHSLLRIQALEDRTLLTAGGWSATGSLDTAREDDTATLLTSGDVLVAGGFNSGGANLASAELYSPTTGTWSATGNSITARSEATATLLNNGEVLVAGGFGNNNYLSSAELYNPATGTWSATGSLHTAREYDTATLLTNGEVLVAGGYNGIDPLSSAELYNPATGTWSVTGSLNTGRQYDTATLLGDGEVLVDGGGGEGPVSSAELYNPTTGTWSYTGSLITARDNGTATLLTNGEVLVTGGGYSSSAELYNPAAGIWSATGSMNTGRNEDTATLLKNGDVLIAGGYTGPTGGVIYTAELYDPTTGIWSYTGNLITARESSTATLLNNGEILVAGGDGAGLLASAELYSVSLTTGIWSATGSLNTATDVGTATLLNNGEVLIAGGGLVGEQSSAELYDPASGTWSVTGSMNVTREGYTATLLNNGEVLVVGGYDGATLSSAELYNPVTGTWSLTGSLHAAREGSTATLLSNGEVLVAGGSSDLAVGIALSSAELYNPSTGTWSLTGSLNTGRYGGTATPLSDGEVLVVGGFGNSGYLASAEMYDPVTGIWSVTGSLNTARDADTATLLGNGQVLVAGGYNNESGGLLASAELYNPTTGTWSVTSSLNVGREGDTAILLDNGEVLVAGGDNGLGFILRSAELYNPATGMWSVTGSLNVAREEDTATLLGNGEALIAGGYNTSSGDLSSAELYSEPQTAVATTFVAVSSSANGSSAYGTADTFTATVTSGGSPVALGSVQFYSDGTPIGSAVSVNGSGEAQSPAITNLQVTGSPHVITADYSDSTDTYVASNGSLAGGQAVTPLVLTISGITASNKSYDGTTTATAQLNLGLATLSGVISPDNVSLITTGAVGTFNFSNVSTATTVTISGLTLTGAQASDYELPAIQDTVSASITPASSTTITVGAGPFTYSGSAQAGGSGTVTGAGGLSTSATSLTYSANANGTGVADQTDAGTFYVTAHYAGDANHTASNGAAVAINIGKAAATVVVTPYNDAYTGVAQTAMVTSITGVNGQTGATVGTVTLNTTHTSPGVYASDSWSFTGGANYNNIASTTITDLISSPGAWSAASSMTAARGNATATVLTNGEVLVAGGYNGSYLSSAELYNPATGIWSATGSMNDTREEDTATLLTNGEVLVAGGISNGAFVSSAELYNPTTGTWSVTGSLSAARARATATLLANGEVLVAGGNAGPSYLSSAELYNPATGTWSATGSMNSARSIYTATLLNNGEVLAAGGDNGSVEVSSAELYNPTTGTWTVTGSLNTARDNAAATLLDNGEVLVAGGYNATSSTLASVELYNPATGTWSATGSLNDPREEETATLLTNGEVLVAGGYYFYLSSAELYDPTSSTWSVTDSLSTARDSDTATLLGNGEVLVAGGEGVSGYLSSAELYDAPSTGAATFVAVSSSANGSSAYGTADTFTATVTSGGSPVALGSVQFYSDGTPIGSAVSVNGSGEAQSPAITNLQVTGSPHVITADYSDSTDTYVASNGSLAGGQAVTPLVLTISGITASNKSYDGTTTATAQLNLGLATLSGVISPDNVSLITTGAVGTFNFSNVSTATTVTISGLTLTGAQASDYELPAIQDTVSASITPASSTTITVGAGPFTYSGSAQAGGSGTVTGAGGLSTSATSLTYSANANGTGVADQTDAGTFYVTAHYAGDANHTASNGAAVAINIGKAAATVVVTPYNDAYTGVAQTAMVTSITGVNGQTGATVGTVTLNTTHTSPGVYASDSWSFTGGANYNNIASTTITDLISTADPDFKTVTVGEGQWQYAPSGSYWGFSGTAGISGNSSVITGGNPAAPQGSQVGFVQMTGAMSETVNLAVGTYTFDFLAAQRENYNHGGQTLQVSVDGSVVGSITPVGSSYLLYATPFFDIATAGVHTITITGTNPQGGDNTALLDEVSVQATTAGQVADPDFGAVTIGPGSWQYTPSGSVWTFVGTAGVSGNGSAITGGNPSAPQGSQVGFVQGTGSMSEAVSLSAGSYTLAFLAAQRGNYNHGGQALQAYVDGTAVGSVITPSGSNYASYSSAVFTVTAGTHTIAIVGTNPNGGDNTSLVDNVSIQTATTSTNQLADPDFSAVSVSGWQYAPGGSPWTFTGTAGVSGNGSAITGGNPAAPQGTQVAFVQMNGSLSQTLTLAAGTYAIEFSAAQRGNYSNGGQTLQVSIDGAAVGDTITPGGPIYATYETVAFTVTSGTHTITIVGTNPLGGDNTAILDNVSLQSASANQLTDPDFSAVAVSGWQYAPGGSAWTFTGTSGISGNDSAITGGNPAAPQGSQVAFVQMNGSLSQTLSLPAGAYTLDFAAAQRGNYNHGGQVLQVSVDGTPVGGGIAPAGTSYAVYQSVNFTVSSGTHTITIAGANPHGGDNTALLDGVFVQAALGNQLVDPDFSAVSVSGWQYAPSGSSWSFTGTAGVSGNGSAITSGNPAAPQGSQVAFVQMTGAVSQALTLPAGTYTLDFAAAQRGNYNNGGQSLQISVDGTPINSVTPAGTNYALYSSATFTVTSGAHTLAITGANPLGKDNTALVDDVSVQPVVNSQLADPDFSAVDAALGAWQYAPSGSPWTFIGSSGVSGNNSAISGGNPPAPQGSQAAFVQGNGSLSQAVDLSAGSYTLDFSAAQRGNYNNGGQSLQLLVDGTAVGSPITPAGSSYANYNSISFAVGAGVHTITLAGTNPHGGDNTALVDAVMLSLA